MGASPLFSVIVPHYDGSIDDDRLRRGLDCLSQQTERDFETILLHDGPLSRPLPIDAAMQAAARMRPPIITGQRANDYGHSLRDLGMQQAAGRYIVHFNPDNVLYPEAFAVLRAAALRADDVPEPQLRENPDLLVFAVLMRGVRTNGKNMIWRDPTRNDHYLIYSGFPAQPGLIDAMQVVMARALWQRLGWWYDKRAAGDGFIYARAIGEFGARYVPQVLGEHW